MRKKSSLLSALKTVLKKHPLTALSLLCAIIAAIVLSLLPPLVLEKGVNMMTSGESLPLSLALLYFLLLALGGLTDAGREMLITRFGQKITHELRARMADKLTRLPADYFTKHEAGATTSLMVNDVDTVEKLFSSGLVALAADAGKMAGVMMMLFQKNTGLGAIILLLTPFLFLLTRHFQKKMLVSQKRNRAAMARINNFIPETLRSMRTVRALRKQNYMLSRYDGAIEKSYALVEKTNLYDSVYSPIIIFISAGVIAFVMLSCAAGSGAARFFNMSAGAAVAVIAYIGQVFTPLEAIGMEITGVQSAVAGVKRIDEFFNEKERKNAECAADLSAPCITLSNVTFAYEEKNVLKNLSFTLREGEKATLTGRTGAGKSTVFKLILGLYSPQSGHVFVLGAPADSLPAADRRHLIGTVEQTFHPVPGSILHQITLHDKSITREMAETAARLVGLHDVLSALPQGYDTLCRAAALSQGQEQLLSIARAVAADPKILLLDEITANLDSETEDRVLTALQKASERRTVLSISHRLYEKTRGRIIEIGQE